MKLIIVRHGETEWNQQNRIIGQLDSPLTPKGIQQAYALANRLSHYPFTSCYSSDLGRAVQTANIITEICGKNVIFEPRLREWNMGIFQGLTFPEADEKFPKERQEQQRIGDQYIIPNGESLRQCRDRGHQALNEIAERHSDETVVVVTHGCLLIVFLEIVFDLAPKKCWRFKINHANFCSFEYINGCWSLVVWNDTSHLTQL